MKTKEERAAELQARKDHEGNIKRRRKRLSMLKIGWIELKVLANNHLREEILAGLSVEDRLFVEEVETMYSRWITGSCMGPGCDKEGDGDD